MKKEELSILLVEDDVVDKMAITRSFKKMGIKNSIVHAVNGIEALEILKGEHPEKSIKHPFLVLLDINMPKMNGLEFLEYTRKDEVLSKLVIFILTTSKLEEDKMRAYNMHVAGYIVKSDAGNGFLDAVELLDKYWKTVEFPKEN